MINKIINLPNKLPLRVVLIVPLMLLLSGVVGVVGYLSFRNGQQAVNRVAIELQNEVLQQSQKQPVIPEADYLERIQANIRETLLLCMVALIVTLILCILIARWITHPVLSLNQSAKAIANGQWNHRVNIQRLDELGQLANSFNQMAEQLQTAFAEMQTLNQTLAQNEARLKAFLDSIPLGIAVVDAAGRPYYFNQQAIQLTGKGVVSSVTIDQLTETYQTYIAGTNQKYPTEKLNLNRALRGERSRTDDLEIHRNGTVSQ